jgi:2-oxoglutarate dehydrogenase E2 component (dihydrolipoamide succinyltransferase)
MTKILLTMPQPGETITEGHIVRWIAHVGDVLTEGAPLVELETEKAVFEYESPFLGTLECIMEEAGQTVKVGEPIAIFETTAEAAARYLSLGVALAYADADKASQTQILPQPKNDAPEARQKNSVGQIQLSPFVRKRAAEAHVEPAKLTQLAAQNAETRVTKAALENHLASQGAAKLSVDIEVRPVSPIRRRIAENMMLSKTTIPHAHTGLAVDVSGLTQWRREKKAALGTELSYMALIQPALMKAILAYPVVNASLVAEKNEIHCFKNVHLGVAVGSEQGLVIPVIRQAQNLTYTEFNERLQDIIKRALIQKLKPDEVGGASFIFNNYGYYGTTFGVQIIQPPLSAILGMGAIQRRVVPVGEPGEDVMGIREIADFSLAFDHRVMDGREAGLFLSELRRGIEALLGLE